MQYSMLNLVMGSPAVQLQLGTAQVAYVNTTPVTPPAPVQVQTELCFTLYDSRIKIGTVTFNLPKIEFGNSQNINLNTNTIRTTGGDLRIIRKYTGSAYYSNTNWPIIIKHKCTIANYPEAQAKALQLAMSNNLGKEVQLQTMDGATWYTGIVINPFEQMMQTAGVTPNGFFTVILEFQRKMV